MPELITTTITNTAVYTLSNGNQLVAVRSVSSGEYLIIVGLIVVALLLAFQITLQVVKR